MSLRVGDSLQHKDGGAESWGEQTWHKVLHDDDDDDAADDDDDDDDDDDGDDDDDDDDDGQE